MEGMPGNNLMRSRQRW